MIIRKINIISIILVVSCIKIRQKSQFKSEEM